MVRNETTSPFNLTVTAVFTALVCVTTMILSIYVPATQGFFNVGEAMVFLSAILFGPFVGAFAGGFGSMAADLLLGYAHYAPATLIVKACEGAVVGTMKKKHPKFRSSIYWRFFIVILGIVIGVLLAWIGASYYSGSGEIALGSLIFMVDIPIEFWVVLGAVTAVAIAALAVLADPEFSWTVFSVVSGGFVMVTGYFLYQRFLLYPLFGIEVVAILEIPVNIGQMIIGAVIALPVTKIVLRSVPYLRDKQNPTRA